MADQQTAQAQYELPEGTGNNPQEDYNENWQDADKAGGWITAEIATGEGGVEGEWYTYDSSGLAKKAQADVFTNCAIIFMLTEDTVQGVEGKFLKSGNWVKTAWGLDPSKIYYLDQSTPGAWTTTAPVSGIVVILGRADQDTETFQIQVTSEANIAAASDHSLLNNLNWDDANHVFDIDMDMNSFGIYNLTGISPTGAVNAQRFVYGEMGNLNTAVGWATIYSNFTKTAGATDFGDNFTGIWSEAEYDQTGGEIGDFKGIYNDILLTDGDIGVGGNEKDMYGILNNVMQVGGVVTNNLYGIYSMVDQNGGTVDGNAYGAYIGADFDGTVTGNAYMLYIADASNLTYGIFQEGVAKNFFNGHIGIGQDPSDLRFLYIGDSAYSTTTTTYGIEVLINKTAGVTDGSDILVGILSQVTFNQAGGVLGDVYGMYAQTKFDDGTISDDLFGMYSFVDLNGGIITDNMYAFYGAIDQEAGNTINGDAFGMYISADLDGTVTGTAYMLYLDEATGLDYGIYQNGTTDNYFGGSVGIGDSVPERKLHVEDSAAVTATFRSTEGTGWSLFDIQNTNSQTWQFGINTSDDAFVIRDRTATSSNIFPFYISTGFTSGIGLAIEGSTGYVGVGVTSPAGHFTVQDTTVNTTVTYYGIYGSHTKTAGATDHDDSLYGIYNLLAYNQNAGEIGNTYGSRNIVQLIDGTIGDGVNVRSIYGFHNLLDLNAGTVTNSAYGLFADIDQEAGNTIDSDVYGIYIQADLDGTVTGTSYMLYLREFTGVDFGIYQNGTAENYFGGRVGIGIEAQLSTVLHLYGSDYSEGTATGQLAIQSNTAYDSSPKAGIVFINEHTPGSQAIMGGIHVGKLNASNGNYAGYMSFNVRKQGAVAYEAMRIDEEGNLGIGTGTPAGHLTVQDNAVDTTATYYGAIIEHQKTAGATDGSDVLYGISNGMVFNQAGGTIGTLWGIASTSNIIDGTIDDDFYGISVKAILTGGIVSNDVFGIYVYVDQAAGNTISGDSFGAYIDADYNGTLTGTSYMLYLNERTGIDFGIYQSGSAPNYFGGAFQIDGTVTTGIDGSVGGTFTINGTIAGRYGQLINSGSNFQIKKLGEGWIEFDTALSRGVRPAVDAQEDLGSLGDNLGWKSIYAHAGTIAGNFQVNGILETQSGIIREVDRKTGNYTLTASDHVVFFDTDGGVLACNLPAGVAGTEYRIVNTGSSANTLSVNPNGAELLLGSNSAFNLNDGESLIIHYDSVEGWF